MHGMQNAKRIIDTIVNFAELRLLKVIVSPKRTTKCMTTEKKQEEETSQNKDKEYKNKHIKCLQ